MITYEAALERMMAAARPLESESVPLAEAWNRVLAEDVRSDVDSPPFDKAAMDGYACRRQDLARELTVIEEIPAGRFPEKTVGAGECAKIMTGAPVPAGADTVVMREDVEPAGPGRIRVAGEVASPNICRRGEDVAAGTVVMARGDLITPAGIAVLASAGCTRPRVSRRPCVGVIATGDELVAPGQTPGPAAIRNSNSDQLCAQAGAMGAAARDFGIVRDTPQAIASAVAQMKQACDLVLVSGGVSAGDYDFVPAAFLACGFTLAFDSVAMQPGRPTVFGTDGRVYCCGLPGNPVSAFVVFEIMLKPFLYRLMGHELKVRWVAAVLDRRVQRRSTVRASTVPVAFPSPGHVTPLDYHGSAHIAAMSRAEGLLTLPAGVAVMEKGAEVHVRPL